MSKRTFVGFGFGPIQSGLFLYEAYASGNFGRFVVAEIDKALVQAVRDNGGRCSVNIARRNGIDQCVLDGIELYNPAVPEDREKLIQAIAEADELATSLPSVRFYDAGNETSVASMIAAGLSRRKNPRLSVVYTAENNNHAAELLLPDILKHTSPASLTGVQLLNTVIGKMSGVITEAEVISRMGLATMTPGLGRAVLVEEFNHILITRVAVAGFTRGIEVFVEKDDLLPFEEAKLFGHNAIHAMIGYLADLKGLTVMSQASGDAWIMDRAKRAFIEESGGALIRKHRALNDPLFTEAGYREYADDLLERMVNPYLNDLVDRVGRDHVRKLSYNDRLFGTMHLALVHGIEPRNLALGAAAGVLSMIKRQDTLKTAIPGLPRTAAELTPEALRAVLMHLWQGKADQHAEHMIQLTWDALGTLQ